MHAKFEQRHLGSSAKQVAEMLQTLDEKHLHEFIGNVLPPSIRTSLPEDFPSGKNEEEFLAHLSEIAKKNQNYTDFIGNGYYPSFTPSVIKRNLLENPGWYTQYTPYQAEISQGRLEVLFYFQSIICDLTQLPLANASLLDEANAAAEAMLMMHAFHQQKQTNSSRQGIFLLDKHLFPQIKNVLYTKSIPLGIRLEEGDLLEKDIAQYEGIIVQYPNREGQILDHRALFQKCRALDVSVCVVADPLSLALLDPPGKLGASIVVGSTQRFGIPLGFGGPHAAYLACEEKYKRFMPGRIIGKTVDAQGNPCFRMALQTREQHIKREKATSNICTAQALLAMMATLYVIYHGKEGITRIAQRIASYTHYLAKQLHTHHLPPVHAHYFDTLKINVKNLLPHLKTQLENAHINVHYYEDQTHIGISINETTTLDDIHRLLSILLPQFVINTTPSLNDHALPAFAQRTVPCLEDALFSAYNTEHKLLRFIFAMQEKDLSLTKSMIALGSCTMKLNATTSLLPISMPEFANIHPLAPSAQTQGYTWVLHALERQLCAITQMDACSLQPNSGAQGEYAGLLCMRSYFHSIGQAHRKTLFIPISAHGTNPASAKIAGFDIVVLPCTERGAIDLVHLRAMAEQYKDELAGLMITYPSTFGVFDENIEEVTAIIHAYGGQVYMDGANMNAQVGLTSPAKIGADVCHLNLHKTFSIPHGGGGPGVGPICVKKHLTPFLPSTKLFSAHSETSNENFISATPYGSASICLIAYAYIYMMGKEGLTQASTHAILNANYMKKKLEPAYGILYTNSNGYCAHEFILDIRPFKASAKIEVEDVAKRLMDYGFHAPTVSFPIAGTLMIEPTESEDKEELDRFCDALVSIREEIRAIEDGGWTTEDNPLKHAPHSMESLCQNEWKHTYTREQAAFPLPYLRKKKFWIPINRVNQAYGDRNLVCSCMPIESYLS